LAELTIKVVTSDKAVTIRYVPSKGGKVTLKIKPLPNIGDTDPNFTKLVCGKSGKMQGAEELQTGLICAPTTKGHKAAAGCFPILELIMQFVTIFEYEFLNTEGLQERVDVVSGTPEL